jgi:CRISPR-associated protein Cas2
MHERWWLICYDVRDDKRLKAAARHLLAYGQRMQYSVFRCWLSQLQMERLRWELTELLHPEDDVLLVPLCSRCHKGIRWTHSGIKSLDWPDAPPPFVIV